MVREILCKMRGGIYHEFESTMGAEVCIAYDDMRKEKERRSIRKVPCDNSFDRLVVVAEITMDVVADVC